MLSIVSVSFSPRAQPLLTSTATNLGDWGYPETTYFIDPMEDKYRAKSYSPSDSSEGKVQEKLEWFAQMDAYKDPYKVEEALVSYWANGGKPASKTTLSTSTRSASASSTKPLSSTPSATTTKPPSSTRAPSSTTRAPTSTRRSSSTARTTSSRRRV